MSETTIDVTNEKWRQLAIEIADVEHPAGQFVKFAEAFNLPFHGILCPEECQAENDATIKLWGRFSEHWSEALGLNEEGATKCL